MDIIWIVVLNESACTVWEFQLLSTSVIHVGSSRSALTTVSSTVNDDFDSDFSDLEVTNLT